MGDICLGRLGGRQILIAPKSSEIFICVSLFFFFLSVPLCLISFIAEFLFLPPPPLASFLVVRRPSPARPDPDLAGRGRCPRKGNGCPVVKRSEG